MSYLDNAATAPIRPAAREAWLNAVNLLGNPSSTHAAGRRARNALDEARERVAQIFRADPAEVIFVSGGTEADNLAVLGAVRAGRERDRTRFVTSGIEHPAVLNGGVMLKQEGYDVVTMSTDGYGRARTDDLEEIVDESTALISLMWVNNETGVIQNVSDAVIAGQRSGALVHSDAVQAAGHLDLSFADSGLDLMSISGHKCGGVVGSGVLLARRGVALKPVSAGGGQERGLRSGTIDVAGAVSLAAALEESVQRRAEENTLAEELRQRLEDRLSEIDGVYVTGRNVLPELESDPGESVPVYRVPGISHSVIDGLRSEDLLFALDRAGISASAGSACQAGVHQPSHVMEAMGASTAHASATLRISFGWSNTPSDVDTLLSALPAAIERARDVAKVRK